MTTHGFFSNRALAHFPFRWQRAAACAVINLGAVALLVALSPHTHTGWRWLIGALARAVGEPVAFPVERSVWPVEQVYPSVYSATLDVWTLGICAAMVVASLLISVERTPARYALRIVAFFLAVPALGLWALPDSFAVTINEHVSNVLRMGYDFLLLTPVILGVTGFIFPGNLLRKTAVMVVATAYMWLTVPLLAVLHLIIAVAVGLAWLPFLNMFCNVLLLSFEVICFYSLLAAQD